MKKTMILILLLWSSATNQAAGRGSAIKNLLKTYVKGVNLIPQGERVRRGGMASCERDLASHGVRGSNLFRLGRREAVAGFVLCCHGPGESESPGVT
jgi:hypothetical protein